MSHEDVNSFRNLVPLVQQCLTTRQVKGPVAEKWCPMGNRLGDYSHNRALFTANLGLKKQIGEFTGQLVALVKDDPFVIFLFKCNVVVILRWLLYLSWFSQSCGIITSEYFI